MSTLTKQQISDLNDFAIEYGIKLHDKIRLLMEQFDYTFDAAKQKALENEEARRQTWLTQALDPWCKRHGITRAQAISILFHDHPFVERDKPAAVTRNDLIWHGAEEHFATVTTIEEGWMPASYDRRQAASARDKAAALVTMTGISESEADLALAKAGLDVAVAYAALTGKTTPAAPGRRVKIMIEVDLDAGPEFHPDHLVHKIQHAIQMQRENLGITRESDEETDILAVNVRLHDSQTIVR